MNVISEKMGVHVSTAELPLFVQSESDEMNLVKRKMYCEYTVLSCVVIFSLSTEANNEKDENWGAIHSKRRFLCRRQFRWAYTCVFMCLYFARVPFDILSTIERHSNDTKNYVNERQSDELKTVYFVIQCRLNNGSLVDSRECAHDMLIHTYTYPRSKLIRLCTRLLIDRFQFACAIWS